MADTETHSAVDGGGKKGPSGPGFVSVLIIFATVPGYISEAQIMSLLHYTQLLELFF